MDGHIVKSVGFPGERKFEVVVHDLLKEHTDAIVNAANSTLVHGGGVAAVISRAAGPELDEEGYRIVADHGPVPVGEGVVTTAGNLPFKGVIHVVGPRKGEGEEEDKLLRAVRCAFYIANERGWDSLSFPGVSSGIFAVPHDICARAYIRAVKGFFSEFPDSSLSLIRLVLFEGPLVDAVVGELS